MLNKCINIQYVAIYSISCDPTEDKRYREWIFIEKDYQLKCLAMSLLIFELINHVNNFTALIVNFTNIVVGKLCENT